MPIFTGQGPFKLSKDSFKISKNPYSMNNNADLLFID